MSRIGKKPIIIPAGVDGDHCRWQRRHRKGTQGYPDSQPSIPTMILKIEGNELIVDRPDDEHLHKSPAWPDPYPDPQHGGGR